jgi:hypothetical protein
MQKIRIEYSRKVTYSCTVEVDDDTAANLLELDHEMVEYDSEDGELLLQHCTPEDVSEADLFLEDIRVSKA